MLKEEFEAYLAKQIKNEYIIDEAMNYSLLARSKRFRALLLLNLLKDLDVEVSEGYDMACAIEMVHAYSLIHDDLPAFDNDDYRRGQLTNHKKYNEEIAILAGDGLLTYAFEQIVKSNYKAEDKVELTLLLSQMAGHQGMIKGQQFDKDFENSQANLQQLIEMYKCKTGCLISAPLLSALIIAHKKEQYKQFEQIGYDLGLAFQIQDDLLEIFNSPEEIGKSTSDKDNNKQTYIAKTSIQQSQAKVDELFNIIHEQLKDDYPNLDGYINSLRKRNW